VRFRVEPYFWQTLPFKLGSLALLSVAMAAFGRFVMNRGLRRELRKAKQEASLHRERARIAKDIHDDLGANLTQISLLSELARRGLQPADPAATSVTKLSETARKAFTALDEIVWAVNPSNDTLTNLLDYLAQFALDFLAPTQIRCRIDFPSQPPGYAVAAEARHALYLVLKEALNNVVKHARATEVQLGAVLPRPGFLQLVIIDNGIGFSTTPRAPEADGLGNMQDRMRKAGGNVEINSSPDGGTKIICEVPIERMSALHTTRKSEL
jgi:signal transduction histidine kinase